MSRLLGGAQHFVATLGEQAPRAAEQAVGTAGSQASRAQTAIGSMVEDKPLAVAAAAMAGGAAIGLIAPTTRAEAETLARPTKELVTKAESLVTDTIDTLEQTVGRSTSSAVTSPRKPPRPTTIA